MRICRGRIKVSFSALQADYAGSSPARDTLWPNVPRLGDAVSKIAWPGSIPGGHAVTVA